MDLISEILQCKNKEEIDTLITTKIVEKNTTATKIEQLGFLNYGKTNCIFKGYIESKTRIKYDKLALETYGMETTDFLYEFAYFIQERKISSKSSLIHSLELFINKYFGYPNNRGDERGDVFYIKAMESTTTDEEFFEALKNNKLGYLKGLGVAQCTERGAVAQQILSLFDIESYYCIGYVDIGMTQEYHCFNIINNKNNYVLLDYSCPVATYTTDGKHTGFLPFIGVLSNEEFEEFIKTGVIRTFKEYEYIEKNKVETGKERKYMVGDFPTKQNSVPKI